MQKQLKILKNNKFICVYTDMEDTSKFIFGRIIGVDNEYFAISSFSPYGKSDGVVVKMIRDIIKIEFDGKYIKKMNMLFSKDNKDLNLIEPDNVVYSVLYDSLQTKKVVSIELVSSNVEDVIGVPVEINENICKVFLVDEYGVYDGYALFDICDITQISVSSDEEKTIEKLMTNQGTVSVKTTPKKE